MADERCYGALAEFEQACRVAIDKNLYPDNPHRPVVLPAIARLHALSNARSEMVAEHTDVICRIHAQALDPSSETASREVLEGIWQNATAALIRNPSSWEHATFDEALVSEARKLLFTFLDDDAYLLVPALSAWHFLLAYEIALESRPESAALQRTVRSIVNDVLNHSAGSRSYWLNQLRAFFKEGAGKAAAIPQLNEVLMSLGSPIEKNLAPSGLVDLFTLARLEQAFLRARAQAGDFYTPYLWPRREISRTQGFLTEYGFQPSILKRLRAGFFAEDSRFGPTPESIAYWEDLLTRPPVVESGPAGHRVSPKTLAMILPFNRAEAHRIVRLGYPRKLPLGEISEMILVDLLQGSLGQFVSRLTGGMVKAFADRFPVLREMDPAKQADEALRTIHDGKGQTLEVLERRLEELRAHQRRFVEVKFPQDLQDDPPAHEDAMSTAKEKEKAFDDAADRIFDKIPQDERDRHRNELVFIVPFIKPKDGGPPYVLGKTLTEILKQADTRFGPDKPGELMSLATKDGSVPEEKLDAMRCL